MLQAQAFFSVMLTVGLVVARPRLGPTFRVGPAAAATVGVLVMRFTGLVDHRDLLSTAELMWRPLIAVASIMVTTAMAQRTGLMTWLAAVVERQSGGRITRLFTLVYVLGAATAAILNNDSAILLLTPLVVAVVRRRYPDRPALVPTFALAIFMAAGVAPLVVSNPMNMIVAAYGGIDFNEYAARMIPVAAAGWLAGYAVLRVVFRRALAQAGDAAEEAPPVRATRAQIHALCLVLAVMLTYPAVAYAGGPVWSVALAGAIAAVILGHLHETATPRAIVGGGVSWNILGFLVGVSLLGVGLRNAGVVQQLAVIYDRGGPQAVAVVSAIGSAVVNNHPMSIINMLALEHAPHATHADTLAALIGGDIGPRLLPMGSLAGLLWFEQLRRLKVDVSPLRFAAVGALVTVPGLVVSLAVLALVT